MSELMIQIAMLQNLITKEEQIFDMDLCIEIKFEDGTEINMRPGAHEIHAECRRRIKEYMTRKFTDE